MANLPTLGTLNSRHSNTSNIHLNSHIPLTPQLEHQNIKLPNFLKPIQRTHLNITQPNPYLVNRFTPSTRTPLDPVSTACHPEHPASHLTNLIDKPPSQVRQVWASQIRATSTQRLGRLIIVNKPNSRVNSPQRMAQSTEHRLTLLLTSISSSSNNNNNKVRGRPVMDQHLQDMDPWMVSQVRWGG